MDEILIILLLFSSIWYWWDTQQCNEIALQVCRQKCSAVNFQLLDATVTRERSWLRKGGGSVQICRLYSFEYDSGAPSGFIYSQPETKSEFGEREQGYIVLIGKQVVETHLGRGGV
ncbi:hypothetical protein MNBD_GAMMA05-2570 [hydrothermal vent metagenome]|uniref:DUF3301 domain-containing protein n=1 Tax=hydrothermal vent metagenome TaxID=652676 RepID=A0A3B0WH63_9ZZZZ